MLLPSSDTNYQARTEFARELAKSAGEAAADQFLRELDAYVSMDTDAVAFLESSMQLMGKDTTESELRGLKLQQAEIQRRVGEYKNIAHAADAQEVQRLSATVRRLDTSISTKQHKLDGVYNSRCSFRNMLCCIFPCTGDSTPFYKCVNSMTEKWEAEMDVLQAERQCARTRIATIEGKIRAAVQRFRSAEYPEAVTLQTRINHLEARGGRRVPELRARVC
jgi:hypothetical protein